MFDSTYYPPLGRSLAFLQKVLCIFGAFIGLNPLKVVLPELFIEFFVYLCHVFLCWIVLLIELIEEDDLIKILFHFADDVGNEGRLHFLPLQTLPVYVHEKPVLLHLLYASETESVSRAFEEQFVDEISQASRPPKWKVLHCYLHVPFAQKIFNFCSIFAFVGPPSHGELEHNHSQSIKIRLVGITLLEEDFRSHVDGRSACFIPGIEGLLTELAFGYSEVSDSKIAAFFEYNVLRL